jgi:hypothetical protein
MQVISVTCWPTAGVRRRQDSESLNGGRKDDMKTLKWIVPAVLLLFASSGAQARPKAIDWTAAVNVRPVLKSITPALHVVFATPQTGGHTAALTWTLSTDDTTANCAAPSTCSQSVYRQAGSCPAAFGTPYATGLSATVTSFTDTTPLFGNSCYAITFTINSTESVFSNNAGGSLRPAAPATLVDAEK